MTSILDIRPYHFTWAENLEQICDLGAVLSKRELDRKRIKYLDVGEYDNKRIGERYLFYDFSSCDFQNSSEIKYKWKKLIVDLNEYVPFYLFADKNLLPKFVYSKIEDCYNRNKNGIIFFLKPLKVIAKKIDYLICYGPGAGHGVLFKDLEDFSNFIELPTPDPMKRALKTLLQSGANRYSDYHKKIIESEFLIKNNAPIKYIDKIMYIGNRDDFINKYLHLFKKIFREKVERNHKSLNKLLNKIICVVLPDLELKGAFQLYVLNKNSNEETFYI